MNLIVSTGRRRGKWWTRGWSRMPHRRAPSSRLRPGLAPARGLRHLSGIMAFIYIKCQTIAEIMA